MSRVRIAFMMLTVVLLAGAVAGCSSPAERTVKAGDNVTIDYFINATDGEVLQTSYAQAAKDLGIYDATFDYSPYRFGVGSGKVIKGLDEAVVGMKVNETKAVVVPPEKGFGPYNASLVRPVNLSDLTAAGVTPYVDQTLTAAYGWARVASIDREAGVVYLDFNRQYAGQTLQYQITVRSIE